MFLSHNNPKKLLSTHLEEVYGFSKKFSNGIPIKSKYKLDVQIICEISAISHDFGKYTSFFQEYLEDTGLQSDLKQHSFISALFGAFLLSKVKEDGRITLPFVELIIYVAILHHHGNLRLVSEDVVSKRKIMSGDPYDLMPRVKVVEEQIKDIRMNYESINQDYQPVLALVNLDRKEIINEFFDSWIEVMGNIDKQYYQCKRELKKGGGVSKDVYYYLLLIYSILLNADKYSAANINPLTRLDIPDSLVDDFRRKEFDTTVKEGVNGWRNNIYDTVMRKIHEQRPNFDKHSLYTLTSPTGSGKTLLSLSVACKWRNWIKEEKGYTPRIIYALPFTSIIDQNEHVIQKLLKQLPDFEENQHRYLVKHHHLTTVQYRQENKELPINQSLLLIENWESEIVVTTFIQFFYTIIGYENRALKKFHQIAGSIVILDEIQNVPVEYWPLLRESLLKMSELYNCKFILLTATQPHIFEKEMTIELLENEEVQNIDFFKKMERVSLRLYNNEPGFHFEAEEWLQLFKEKFEDGKSYLAIFNTINTSVKIFKDLRSWLKTKNYKVYYLSTNVIPMERKNRIETIRRVKSDEKLVVVSTQVVEAGVDLDFDIVYRDLGPIDSIIQAAGRCNRQGKLNRIGKLGEIRVTPIARNGTLESKYVYKGIHTNIAKSSLPKTVVSEHQFIDLIADYYMKLKTQKRSDESDNIIDAMRSLRFSNKGKTEQSLVSDFSLIPENHTMVDTFVEIDEDASNVWERYLEKVVYEADFKKRFEANLQLKSELRNYVISAPIKLVKNLVDDDFEKTKMIRIHKDIINQYYNDDFGLIRNWEDGEVWML
ncbi:CRISPR-associated helicase Cas3' [Neobacillus sp. OS1-32]|uniref:CRISPR-associated helicase Cas3' n=1 Tax=Neobacillus sp. OS1-32 TaxID=3070682 RepID=UPI0027E02D44|nr:CRISPR-associated helicase Cas3' [Neobacillus sp. OS1-32]WML28948.1 CRISPR-associated helicase Cas3' [Neobacillus sp. OS1-32]